MKAVILLSGGMDSTTLLARMKEEGDTLHAISIEYGQTHSKEIDCARQQAELYGVPWNLVNLRPIFETFQNPLLGTGEIPKESYEDQLAKSNIIKTYVPNRNMIFLSVAAGWAIELGFHAVAYAAHSDDAAGGAYPDCTPEFFDKMCSVLETQGISLYAPFIGVKKADIVKEGLRLKVNFNLTWSCYYGDMIDKPCGLCGTCRDRAKAFALNGVKEN